MEPEKTIDQEIEHILSVLETKSPDTDEYTTSARNLKTLCEARSYRPASRIELETVLTLATNLIGILMILKYERFDVVTSRAMSFIRPK